MRIRPEFFLEYFISDNFLGSKAQILAQRMANIRGVGI